MEAHHSGHSDGPRAADLPTQSDQPHQATRESGATASVLTFTPRQFYRRYGGRWLIEAEDALDGDRHRQGDVEG
jgi:hypothetical protein